MVSVPRRGVPRWPAVVAAVTMSLLYSVLPSRLRIGPVWLLPVIVFALVTLAAGARRRGYHDLTHKLGLALTLMVTLAVVLSAFLLVARLPGVKMPAADLLRESGLIWLTNILVFALWYWEIDGGGPAMRRRDRHASTDFLFPQMQRRDDGSAQNWAPGLLDYLFLAFNTSTAFSPTDTLVLSPRAKVLMMCQSLISLVVIAVLAARAINTL